MSNFQCTECGMVNIDTPDGYKTPREIELEAFIDWIVKQQYYIFPKGFLDKCKRILKNGQ